MSETNTRSSQRKRKRLKLYEEQNGKCHWCEEDMQITDLPGGTLPPDAATLEHLDDRFNPNRGKSRGAKRVVLACYKCNHERGVASQAGQDQEKLWNGSGHSKLKDIWPKK